MQPHRVAIADLEDRPECVHAAYLDPAEEWNGWACPYFEGSVGNVGVTASLL